jgi:hypothetical protein
MGAKSKNIYDVYTWIKVEVIPSINHPLQESSVHRLIDNFDKYYSDHKDGGQLYRELSMELANINYPYNNSKGE